MLFVKTFNQFVRELRHENKLPLRKVAALLDIDPSTLSKIERGERVANLALVDKFSEIFSNEKDQIRRLYLSDRIVYTLKSESDPEDILFLAEQKIKYGKSS